MAEIGVDHPPDSSGLARWLRYGIMLAATTCSFVIAFVLQASHRRDPYALVFLAAIAVSVWCGGRGPGIIATIASTTALGCFLYYAKGSLNVTAYDIGVYSLYFLFVSLLWWFSHVRRKTEQLLQKACGLLTTEVQLRTTQLEERNAELSSLNTEYKTILNAAPFGVALLSPDRTVRRCNPAYERMIGYQAGELIGQQAPIPETARKQWNIQMEKLRAGEQIIDHETFRTRRDGSQFYATISLTPLCDQHGTLTDLVGLIIDNTERNAREAERHMLTALVEHCPDLVSVSDETGKMTFINSAGRRLLGLNSDDDPTPINLLDRFGQEGGSSAQSALLQREDGKLHIEGTYRDPSTSRMVQLHCTSFTIPSAKPGAPVLRALLAQDVSERKEAETKLRMSLDENQRLLEEIRTLQERLQHENISLQERNLALQSEIADIQRAKFEKIVGGSPALRRTLSKVEQVAATDVTVLITGETGTGKELIAQAIHENSKRAQMPFRAINCAAFPTTLMASELFGHERGAFTGADRQRLGQFELASGGTLFLDEIAELPLETQAMLLRVLEEHSFERLGGTKSIRSDVRIVVATNRDLQASMQHGEFRQDLFFRLNGFRIEVPSLRERQDDIPLLVQHFVQVSATRHGKSIRRIEKGAMEMLVSYGWPGNVRELRNVIETSVIISPGEELVIDEELLFGSPATGKMDSGTLEAKVAEYERSLIERALTDTHGRVSGPSGAATLLGMPASTLSARIRVLKIDVARFKIQSE